jgi:hypothetical protein
MLSVLRKGFLWLADLSVMQGFPVARGFIPVGLQSSPKTCQHGFYRHTACEQIAPAAQPSGDESPHHKDAVHIPGCCLCEERTPCGWQIYQSCRDSLWRGDSSPLGCKAAPKPAGTVSTGTPHVSKLRLLRSRAGTPCGEGIHPRWAAKQPQNLPPQFLQAHRM